MRSPGLGARWVALSALIIALVPAIVLRLTVGNSQPVNIWLRLGIFVASALASAFLAIFYQSWLRRSARWSQPSGRVSVPQQLPVRLRQFRGREEDLQALTAECDLQLRGRSWSQALRRMLPPVRRPQRKETGPVVLVIEGMPGVGKTALAQEFAHRMASTHRFPDGQLFASLGYVGGRRAPADVLQKFLAAMGIDEHRLPAETGERVNLFRSMTIDRRLIVLLDAAHEYDQVTHLLPRGSRCLVIITTRWSLGAEPAVFRYPLAPPQPPDALRILTAFARTELSQAAAEAAEIVDYCGALPLALRNVGEQIADGHQTIRGFAARLNDKQRPGDRLAEFSYRGRDMRRRLEFEYQRLPAAERRALRMLAIVESPTFGPWVLAPLMRVTELEAEGLAVRLASYHLLLDLGEAANLGLPRYSMHPLVRLTAEKLFARDEPAAERDEARSRLYSAYLAVVHAIFAETEPTPRDAGQWRVPASWRPSRKAWTKSVRNAPDRWVRAEYCTLVRTLSFAHGHGAWHDSWYLAARLGACVTNGLDPDESVKAFDAAAEAADKEPSRLGAIEVLLARGSFLIAVERYADAFAALQQALTAADQAAAELGPEQVHLLWASVHRRKAEAWLQLGSYASAAAELQVALSATTGLNEYPGMAAEVALIRAMIAENDSWRVPSKWLDPAPFHAVLAEHPDDSATFHALLGLAEQACRQRRWDQALENFRRVREDNYGDVRRSATVQYRTARLLLRQAGEATDQRKEDIVYQAVGYASDTVRIFRTMRNPVGVIRAGTLLVLALSLAERFEEASALADELDAGLRELITVPAAVSALRARVSRCRAEVALAANQNGEAARLLSQAIDLYERADDWRSATDATVVLATAQDRDGQPDAALASLMRATDKYVRCSDGMATAEVEREHARIIRQRLGRKISRYFGRSPARSGRNPSRS